MAANGLPPRPSAETHTLSQRYLSTRGEDNDFSFEDVVLKGLASDGGLYIPEEIPKADKWQQWKDLSFKDVALQFLGNLFEYFLVRRNEGNTGKDRHHLTVVGATSGDTGPAAIYGLRGKKDVSVFILHPKSRVSPIQEAQMTTVLDENVHNIAYHGTFDDCQDIVKALFANPEMNSTHKLGAVNSINFARILAQISATNFGDVLAGYFAHRMGLPVEKFVVATNENDILDRFFKTGRYEKKAPSSEGSADPGVKETLSPAMDILVSSNFERLLWFLAYEFAETAKMDDEWNKKQAGQEVTQWLRDLKNKGGFGPVYQDMITSARRNFESERVSDAQTVETIKGYYNGQSYVLDPHSAVGVTAAERSAERNAAAPHISLSTAHPAKFAGAVELALKEEAAFSFEDKVLPPELRGIEGLEKRVKEAGGGWEAVRELVRAQVAEEIGA